MTGILLKDFTIRTVGMLERGLFHCVGAFFLFFFMVSCASKSAVVAEDDDISYDGIVALHKDMNDKRGLGSTYHASVAVANEEYDVAYRLYHRECISGSTMDCLSAYFIGEERALSEYNSEAFAELLATSIRRSLRACKDGVSLGCVNVFFAFEAMDDEGSFLYSVISPVLENVDDESIADKTMKLTKKECDEDDATSCFYHSKVLRAMDPYANVDPFIEKGLELGYALSPFVRLPLQSPQTVEYFKQSCGLDEALSCRYVGHWLDKYDNDQENAKIYYKKACDLGLESACMDSSRPTHEAIDEVGAPVLKPRN